MFRYLGIPHLLKLFRFVEPNSKLTLDLAGGEVRIRPQRSPSCSSHPNNISYITLPGAESTPSGSSNKQQKIQCMDELPIRLHTPPSASPYKTMLDQASVKSERTTAAAHTISYSQQPASPDYSVRLPGRTHAVPCGALPQTQQMRQMP